MFNYSLKTKIIIIVSLLAVAIATIVATGSYNSRSRDLALVSQAKVLANSLEKHYDKFRAYPVSDTISAESIRYITEEGINQEGDILYFRPDFDWAGEATYASNGKDYRIEFELNNSWPLWGIEGGSGICRISYGLNMQCVSSS